MRKLSVWIAVMLLCWTPVVPALGAASQDTYREAYDAGFQDGSAAGAKHRENHRAFDYANDPAYVDATRGYDPQVHNRDVYRLAYRRGFVDGYEEGYGIGANREAAPPQSAASAPSPAERSLAGRYVVPKDTEIRIRLLDSLATQRNEVGDKFRAETVGDVIVDGEVAIPSGSRIYGEVTLVKRAGRIRGRSELTLGFRQVELPDGHKFPFDATVISIEEQRDEKVKNEEGTLEAPSGAGNDAKKIGASAGLGALIGVLAGGGAKVGAAIGALTGTAGVLAMRGSDLILPVETELVVRLNKDVTVLSGLLRKR